MYSDNHLNLERLYNPNLLDKDSELFYGFWGQALNRSQRSSGTATTVKIVSNWKEAYFQLNDPRFQVEEKKKGPKEETPQDAKKFLNKPNRLFIVTSNIDGEFLKEGFSDNELYETRGDILSWQCSIPCCKNVFRTKEDFRFEISQESGRAPSLKYAENKNHKKPENEDNDQDIQTITEDDCNIYSATGKKDYFKKQLYMEKLGDVKILGKENMAPSTIAEKRGTYFQFFAPKDVPDKFKNPGIFQRPGSASRRTSSLFGRNNYILGSLADLGSTTNHNTDDNSRIQPGLNTRSMTEKREAVLQRYNLLNTDIEPTSDHSHQPKTNVHNNLKLVIENKRGEETKMEAHYEDIHASLHDLAFSGEIDPSEEGYLEVNIIDPMIHYHQFYTDVHNSDEILTEKDLLEFRKHPVPIIPKDHTLVSASPNMRYIISLKVTNLDDELSMEPILSYTSKVSPTIRRKREEDGIFVDSVIINVEDVVKKVSSNPKHTLPVRGKVSMIVQPLKPSSYGNSFKLVSADEKPWQLVGEYNMRLFIGTNSHSNPKSRRKKDSPKNSSIDKQSSHFHNVRMLDLSLKTRDSVHSLKLRAVQQLQHASQNVELSTIFVDMPITDFTTITEKKKQNLNISTTSISTPTTGSFTPTSSMTPTPMGKPPIDFESAALKKSMNYSDLVSSRVKSEEDIDQYNPRKQPVINRIFCETCRGAARPRMRMNIADEKWIKTSMIPFKTWSTKIKKIIQEEGRNVVVLEIGAEAKLRTMTDAIVKQNSGTEVIRINPKLRVIKGQKEKMKVPSGAEGQYNIIEDPSSSAALKKIDQFLSEIAERFASK